MNYFLLALGWGVWCFFHSLLLSGPVKARLSAAVPVVGCHWRFFYSAVAVAAIVPLVLATYLLDGPVILAWPLKWPLLVINIGVLILGYQAIKAFGGAFAFLGLDTLAGSCEPPRPDKPYRSGILGWVRHPLYALTVVLLWAHDMPAAWLVTSSVLTVYVLTGTWIEEKRLEKEWGTEWLKYRQEVSALFPWKKLKKMIRS